MLQNFFRTYRTVTGKPDESSPYTSSACMLAVQYNQTPCAACGHIGEDHLDVDFGAVMYASHCLRFNCKCQQFQRPKWWDRVKFRGQNRRRGTLEGFAEAAGKVMDKGGSDA